MTNPFWNEDELPIEYLHRGISPEHATFTGSPPAGTEIAVPICITMHVRNGKIDVFNEYLDLSTLSSGPRRQLFVQNGTGYTKQPTPAVQAIPPKMPNAVDFQGAHPAALESSTPTHWRTKLMNPLLSGDYDTAIQALADDCEWVVMPNFKSFKGQQQCFELCKSGKLASYKRPDAIVDLATAEWGVFEYINKGTITKDLTALGALDSDFKLSPDLSTLVGRDYAVAVCFVYWFNAEGKIRLVHEFLDLENLKKQFQATPVATA